MKQFIALCGIAVALIAAIVLLQPAQNGEQVTANTRVLPSLDGNLNAVTRVQIARGDNTTTLSRGETGWQVDELSYPAKTGKLRELLLSLSDAKVLESKTARSDRYSRLGVHDFATEGAPDNTLVRITVAGSETGLLIGNDSAQGHYVRVEGAAQSALADTSFNAPSDPKRWIQTELLNVSPDALRSVVMEPASSENYSLTRTESGWAIDNLPEGREPMRANLSRPTRLLQNLRIETVLPTLENPAVEAWNRAIVTADSGLIVTLEFAEADAGKLMRVSATAGAPTDGTADPATGSVLGQVGNRAGGEQSARAMAGELNARTRGRVFVVQDYKFADGTLRLEQLLMDESAEQ